MASSHTPFQLASRFVQLTGHAIVLIDACNCGDLGSWEIAFPSLDPLQIDSLVTSDGSSMIEFDTEEVATEFFQSLVREATQAYDPTVSGTVYLITRTGDNRSTAKRYDVNAVSYPVLQDGHWQTVNAE